ncbi:uncharacterized protein [Typha latifolia]|uniref:uncharacterized protein n=1 Tax=Typha latifolia TaxID=4733 RepID=UPI003C2C0490
MATYTASLLLLVVILSLWMPKPVLTSGSTVENAMDRANVAKDEAMQDAKEKSESWSDWARDKLTDTHYGSGLGLGQDQMKDEAEDIAMKTKEKMEEAKDGLKNKAEGAEDEIGYGPKDATGTAGKAFEGAKKAEKAYENAKDTMTGSAKAKYEEAKERASQATGDLGAKMNTKAGEL